MVNSPQDTYARNLLSHYGYPLRTPEPSIELPDCYRREGLRIGDVGVVVPEDGSFDVFFNITLPSEHPLHAVDGVPEDFTQVKLKREDYRIVPDAEGPGRVISPSTVGCTVSCIDPFYLDGVSRRLTDHQFSLHQNEGAMLILPQGAERHRLVKELLLLEIVIQNAVNWYRFAREKLYRNINNDALYLITGFHKAQSWSLASFKNTGASSVQCKIVQLRKGGSLLPDDSTWETTYPLEWRIGPRHSSEVPNQSVFIVGFKIKVNEELLYLKRVTVKADNSNCTLATTFVGHGASLANFLSWTTSMLTHSSDAATPDERASESTSEHDSPEDTRQEDVKVDRVPQISQPFHPSDIINRYLLNKEPSAKIAVTHDSQWIALLEKGILRPHDMLQGGCLEAALSQEYTIVLKDGAVYLQSNKSPSLVDQAQITPVLPLQPSSWDHLVPTSGQSSGRGDSVLSHAMEPRFPRLRLDALSMPSRGERWDLSSNRTMSQCLWTGGKTQCTELVACDRRSLTVHLRDMHGFTCDGTTIPCVWGQCGTTMQRRNIPRHIIARHIELKVTCPQCGIVLSRVNANRKHLLACTGAKTPAMEVGEEDDGRQRSPGIAHLDGGSVHDRVVGVQRGTNAGLSWGSNGRETEHWGKDWWSLDIASPWGEVAPERAMASGSSTLPLVSEGDMQAGVANTGRTVHPDDGSVGVAGVSWGLESRETGDATYRRWV